MSVYTDTTETLTKMIPVAVAGRALRSVSRRAKPKRRRVVAKRRHVCRKVVKRVTRKRK